MVAGGMADSNTNRGLIIPAVSAAGHQRWKGGYDGICTSPVEGGGQVIGHHLAVDGGQVSDIAEDVVLSFRWYQHVSGWTTTSSNNTTQALNDPQAVMAAYPDATPPSGGHAVIDDVGQHQK
jgi:hypothetical protein